MKFHVAALIVLSLMLVLGAPAAAQSGGDLDVGSCPADLVADPQDDGSVLLTWSVTVPTESLNVFRTQAGGFITLIATLPPGSTSYHDTTATAGVAYDYEVRGIGPGGEESHACQVVTVTTVPFFTTGAALRALVGLGAALVVMRKR